VDTNPSSSPPSAAKPRAWFAVHPKGLVVRREGKTVSLPTDADFAALTAKPGFEEPLGTFGDREAFAITVETVPPPLEVAGIRELAGFLGESHFGLAARAIQLAEWADTSRFCGRCATPTVRVSGERCQKCPACGFMAYPRIAPAVIVLVRRGDQALLARGARFPGAFYSTLAGFSEVGETFEETLAREVREEVGVEIKSPRYFGSQPWPFPHSLMVGFHADWDSGEIQIDGKEILDAQWYEAGALPAIPPKISIAGRLIASWVEAVRGPQLR
jgi:NAD+ diphosphatase